ncbi:MAG: NADH-quinone oxidoreductase subunit C, partial [Spirosomataceae bacterium]
MKFEEIREVLSLQFGEDVFKVTNHKTNHPIVQVPVDKLIKVCLFLNRDERLYFDYLTSLTGIDNGPEKGTLEVVYHFVSIPYEHSFILKVEFPRNTTSIPSISAIWKTADWHERETYDLVGIVFNNHPD